jgi:outer membrane protein TolC
MAAVSTPAVAEQREAPVPNPLALTDAIRYALDHYPAVQAKLAEKAAAESNVGLARTAYLPKIDALVALNRGTRNNVFGMFFPQQVIPGISGPVLDPATSTATFGSAAGVSVGWEPFDFGGRSAGVGVAAARRDEADAQLALTRHQVALVVADTFLTVAANQQALRASQANVDRFQTVQASIHVLVENQLRPGADESRIQVELAIAREQAIRAEALLEESLATLAELLGVAGARVRIDANNLLTTTPGAPIAERGVENHPLAVTRLSAVHSSEARLNALTRASYPKITLQGAVWSRGTGALADGTFLGGGNGLAPTTANGAIGLAMTFSFSDLTILRQKKAVERHTEAAEQALYDQAVQKLTGDLARARAAREGAEKSAENTLEKLRAARTVDEQSRARYQAGLGTVIELADAQRLLTQADTDAALARLLVWRALLSEAAAAGDILNAFK